MRLIILILLTLIYGCSLIYPWYHYSMFSNYKILNTDSIKVQSEDIVFQNLLPKLGADKKKQSFNLSVPLEIKNLSSDTVILKKNIIYASINDKTLKLSSITIDQVYTKNILAINIWFITFRQMINLKLCLFLKEPLLFI